MGMGLGIFPGWDLFCLTQVEHQDVACRGTMRQNAKPSRSEVSFFLSLSCFLPMSWGYLFWAQRLSEMSERSLVHLLPSTEEA